MTSIATSTSFDLLATLRIKHGALADAVRKVGSQSELARTLEVNPTVVSAWCCLKLCPPKEPTRKWPAERLEKLEKDLLALTGKTLEELFPDELRRQCHAKNYPRSFERRIQIEREQLAELATLAKDRMTLPCPSELVEHAIDAEALHKSIDGVLKTLSYREREIIKMRFGLGCGASYTLDEVAHVFKVGRERIRQIEAKAIRKLQQPSRSCELIGYLVEDAPDEDEPVLSPLTATPKTHTCEPAENP